MFYILGMVAGLITAGLFEIYKDQPTARSLITLGVFFSLGVTMYLESKISSKIYKKAKEELIEEEENHKANKRASERIENLK
jgi:hypothetical protein